MKKSAITIFFFCVSFLLQAQILTPQQYIEKYKGLAIMEQKRLGIPAAITLAQGLLETENGNSDLVLQSNNHFGIKCKSNWTGATVFHDDDAAGECFRKYNTAEESYRDHSEFLKNSSRYAGLFALSPTDYKGWAYGLRKAGYATNPRYPEILIRHIETYNLQQFDYSDYAAVEVNFAENKTIAPSPAPAAVMKAQLPVVLKEINNNSMVNGLKAMFASKGTSLLAIATVHKIKLNKLLDYNDLSEDGLLPEDQFVYLEKKQKEGKVDYYTTKTPETLYDISQNLGVQLAELATYNNMDRKASIGSGSRVALKPGLKPDIVQNNNRNAQTHIVEAKEGLYAIARKYSISVQDLKAMNNMASDDLKVGQQIYISK